MLKWWFLGALSQRLEWRTLAHCRQWARNRWCAHIRALQRARGRALVQADGPDAFQLRSACSCACAALLATGPWPRREIPDFFKEIRGPPSFSLSGNIRGNMPTAARKCLLLEGK